MKKEETRGQLMTSQVQVALENPALEATAFWRESEIDEMQVYRSGAYKLLASLLRSTPDQAMLEHIVDLSGIETETDELSIALSMLGLAARHCESDAIDDEYHALFIGLGRGELVPYGSWYLTGFLMEKPLGILRDDLARLGYERTEQTSEPEDHIAALCEVMSLMIDEGLNEPSADDSLSLQQQFFAAHIGTWAEDLFSDMTQSPSAVFYRSVGRFGSAFIEFEKRYLSMKV